MKVTKWDIYEQLKTEEDIEGFIEASIEEAKDDTDPKYLIHALQTAARARGMLAAPANFVADDGNGDTDPRASTLAQIANALGYRLTVVKQPIDVKASV